MTQTQGGVQLELTAQLRKELFKRKVHAKP